MVSLVDHNVYMTQYFSSFSMISGVLKKAASVAFVSVPLVLGGMAATGCLDEPFPDQPLFESSPLQNTRTLFQDSLLEFAVQTDPRYFSLLQEISPSYRDTAKPNAFALFPATTDHVFDSTALGWFVRSLHEHYDVQLFAAHQKQEAYAALADLASTDPFSINFLTLFGHGTPRTLALGGPICRLGECQRDESHAFNVSDREFCSYLDDVLASDAVIFLGSCATGYGEEDAENFANFIMACAPGRTVYAGTAPFSAQGIRVNSWYPFDATLMGGRGMSFTRFGFIPLTDITYTNKGHEE